MSVKTPVKWIFKPAKHPENKIGHVVSKRAAQIDRIKDPTGIAEYWSENRSAEEIIAAIHDSRTSKR